MGACSDTAKRFRSGRQQYNTSNQVTYSSLNSGAGLTYDAAGDVTYDGLNTYLYDAEGRICAVKNSVGSITGYVYDAAGIRTTPTTKTCRWGPRDVARLGLGALSCNFAPGGVAWNIHASWALGQGGEQVAEFNGAGTWQHSNVYAGKLLGTYDTKGLHFYLDDWLGTRRVQTNSLGQLEMTCQSLPYGNGQNCITTSLTTADNPTEQFFTGKERDPESGDDYFEARYYNSAAGRFLSPDWSAKEEPVPYEKMDDPQTLNLYDYVRNNPMNRVDFDGHQDVGVVIQNGKSFEGHQCGDGECVSFVKQAGGFTTPTKDWKAGPNVLDFADKGLQSGTAIMLADKDGHYPTDGARHAAEFIQFNKDKGGKVIGIKVREQWAPRFDKKTGKKTREGQPVKETDIPIKNGKGTPQGDASQYHILMIPKPKEPK